MFYPGSCIWATRDVQVLMLDGSSICDNSRPIVKCREPANEAAFFFGHLIWRWSRFLWDSCRAMSRGSEIRDCN